MFRKTKNNSLFVLHCLQWIIIIKISFSNISGTNWNNLLKLISPYIWDMWSLYGLILVIDLNCSILGSSCSHTNQTTQCRTVSTAYHINLYGWTNHFSIYPGIHFHAFSKFLQRVYSCKVNSMVGRCHSQEEQTTRWVKMYYKDLGWYGIQELQNPK